MFYVNVADALKELSNPKNVRFAQLLKIATIFFGEPRNKGTSHFVFKTPWQGKPWVNIQREGSMAKPYQVKQVVEALEKLQEMQR
ncbi:MAG: hypothetical protein NDI61_02395 [Bdellovibrionaceae bacterium]|nr:hypothetical protein [Pseudobdellovibrionaceae bacterium]